MNKQSSYSSGLSTVLTIVGVSIGLGNVWRFPYMMGSYGGSAFLVVYLIFTFLFAIPALMSELALGRAGKGGIIQAFQHGLGRRWGRVISYLLLVTVTVSGSYYAVVVANVIFSLFYNVFIGFDGDHLTSFTGLLGHGWIQYGFTLVTIFFALLVIHQGMKAGIETVSKIIIPFFTVATFYLIFFSLSLPGALPKLREFLTPDFSVLHPKQIFAALGQAFFSVGLGGTFMVAYGKYIKKEASIPKFAMFTCLGDVSASILVSLFLIPVILLSGLEMDSGPSLIFNTLPKLFGVLPAGRFTGGVFLLALSLVSFLSLVAAYQVPVASFENTSPRGVSRKRIVFLVGIIQAILAMPSSLYPQLIGTLDLWFGSGMQVLGSVFAIIALGWGLQKNTMEEELFRSRTKGFRRYFSYVWIKYAIPLTLLVILASYIYDSFVT